MSNKGISVWDLSEPWINYVLADHKEIMVALDWTSFFDDEQSMLSLNIVTGKGLSCGRTPMQTLMDSKHLWMEKFIN